MDPDSSQKNSTQKASLPQQQTYGQPPVPNRSSKSLVLFMGALGVVICIMVGVIVFKHSATQKQQGATPFSSYGTNATQPTFSTPPVGGVVFTPITPPNTWKPYTSATYHYSLKYPSEWKTTVSAGGESLALSSPDGVGITITVAATKRTSVYAQFVQEAKMSKPGATLPHTQTTINGIRAIQYTSDRGQKTPGQTTVLVTGGYAYHIIVLYPDQQKEESAQSIYKQLLSSFTYIQ